MDDGYWMDELSEEDFEAYLAENEPSDFDTSDPYDIEYDVP